MKCPGVMLMFNTNIHELSRCLQAPLWKKAAAPARQRRTYKTAEEVLEEAAAGAAAKPLAAQPILDLRGPQARLVTDLEQLNTAAGEQQQRRAALASVCLVLP